MSKLSYGPKLIAEFARFAKESKSYWLVPLIIVLMGAAAVVVISQGAAPLLYTLF